MGVKRAGASDSPPEGREGPGPHWAESSLSKGLHRPEQETSDQGWPCPGPVTLVPFLGKRCAPGSPQPVACVQAPHSLGSRAPRLPRGRPHQVSMKLGLLLCG